MKSANFKLLSLNVRGSGNFKKRRAIFTWCRRKKSDFILLQETHSTRETRDIWKNEWGGEIYFSHGKSNARGVAVLIKNGLDHKIVRSVSDSNGRFLMLVIEIQDVDYTIINVYVPNTDGTAIGFINNVFDILINENVVEEDNLIMRRDFNCKMNPK